MKRLPLDVDVHTHRGPVRPDAVLCVDPVETAKLPEGDGLLSVGIHPWNAHLPDSETWMRLEAWLRDRRVVAMGEIGLDKLRGPEAEMQMDVLRAQLELARERGLPVVIHCVRAVDVLIRLRKEYDAPREWQWILHGFRGKAETARQLLRAGIDLSFGPTYNAEAYAATPAERRYRETD